MRHQPISKLLCKVIGAISGAEKGGVTCVFLHCPVAACACLVYQEIRFLVNYLVHTSFLITPQHKHLLFPLSSTCSIVHFEIHIVPCGATARYNIEQMHSPCKATAHRPKTYYIHLSRAITAFHNILSHGNPLFLGTAQP